MEVSWFTALFFRSSTQKSNQDHHLWPSMIRIGKHVAKNDLPAFNKGACYYCYSRWTCMSKLAGKSSLATHCDLILPCKALDESTNGRNPEMTCNARSPRTVLQRWGIHLPLFIPTHGIMLGTGRRRSSHWAMGTFTREGWRMGLRWELQKGRQLIKTVRMVWTSGER